MTLCDPLALRPYKSHLLSFFVNHMVDVKIKEYYFKESGKAHHKYKFYYPEQVLNRHCLSEEMQEISMDKDISRQKRWGEHVPTHIFLLRMDGVEDRTGASWHDDLIPRTYDEQQVQRRRQGWLTSQNEYTFTVTWITALQANNPLSWRGA